MSWSLPVIFGAIHEDIQTKLQIARKSLAHPVAKGDASEGVWRDVLTTYLPNRYQITKAHIVDSEGTFSEQMDVVVFDRQYSPFIFRYENETILPVESVYAVFEAKQTCNAENVVYARRKVASVRRLRPTSLPIPHAGGVYPPKPPISILGGILTLDSDWNPPLGEALKKALENANEEDCLNMGCMAEHGYFRYDAETGAYHLNHSERPATAFLFKLIGQLQLSGTVPMIDVEAYAQWL